MIEDKIQSAIKPIISIYNQIELDLIERIAEHFNLNEEFINSDYWYIEKLKELGGLNNETLKLLEKYTGKTKKELLKAMQDIGISVIPIQQLNIGANKGLLDPDKILNSVNIQNIIKHSYNEIEKEFLQLNKSIEENVRRTYQDILTTTYAKVNSGAYSYQEAILQTLDDLGDKGISILEYQTDKGIRKYDVVGTVRRDLLVATRGLTGKVNEEVIKESGHHIVRVSHHFGARTGDGDEDFTNHAWWQEKQFFCWNYDGQATEEDKKLPDFMECCNYGHIQGIVGINCKHFFTIWYGPLIKEKLDFTYNENKEQYENTQWQRYLENGVRKWKRKQVIAKGVEDKEGYEKASKKAKEWQERLKEFTYNNELKRDYTREHIKNYKGISTRNNKTYEDITDQMYNNAKPELGFVKEKNYVRYNGIKYYVDGHNVKFDHDKREVEVGYLLNKKFGGNVEILPSIKNMQGVKVPDYKFRNERTDLKRIKSKRANDCVKTALRDCEKQAHNFIIDNTAQTVTDNDILKQIDEIYNSKKFKWVNTIYLLKDEEFLKVFRRK